jgi:hypothetical protein
VASSLATLFAGLTPIPGAIMAALAAAVLTAALALSAELNSADHGQGVAINDSWFTLGLTPWISSQ